MAARARKHLLPEGPLALSLSGGGSRGALSLGTVQYIIEVLERTDFPIIQGTSTGALIAAKIGAYTITQDVRHLYDLVDIYSKILNQDVISPRSGIAHGLFGTIGGLVMAVVTGESSIFDTAPLAEVIKRYLPDKLVMRLFEAGRSKSKPFEIGFVSVDMASGMSELVTNRTTDNVEVFRSALLASSSQPVFMAPVDIYGDGRLFVDGGMLDFTPTEHILRSDLLPRVNGIVNILTNTPGVSSTSESDFSQITEQLIRTISLLTVVVEREDHNTAALYSVLLKARELLPTTQWKTLFAVLPGDIQIRFNKHFENANYVPIFTVYPRKPITEVKSSLDFSQPGMKKLVRRGFREARAWFRAVPTV